MCDLRTVTTATAGVMLACAMRLACAAPASDGPPTGSQPPGPPPEAVTACSGKTEGDVVSFTLRDGHQVSGTCQLTNGVLAARPTGGPGGNPPPGKQD